jgi:hypothetical protein
MNDKSHASLEQHVCLVCGARFDTGAILLDKRLRASMERHTATDWGLCPEHQKLSDDGFVALVECDPQRSSSPSGADRMKPRTGVPDGAFGAPETRGVHSRVQRADRGQAAVRVRRTRRDRAVAGDDCALIARPPSGALSFGTTRLFFCCARCRCLRACGAARFACAPGEGHAAIPAALRLAPLNTAAPAVPARPPPRTSGISSRASTPMLSNGECMGVPGQETWPVALSCCASSLAARVSPPSGFHR